MCSTYFHLRIITLLGQMLVGLFLLQSAALGLKKVVILPMFVLLKPLRELI